MSPVIATVLGSILTLINLLIMFFLKNLKSSLDKQDQRISDLEGTCNKKITGLERKFADCKIDCDRTNVSKEDWIRSEGYTRNQLDNMTKTMNRMEGQLNVIDKLPAITAQIVHAVVGELNIKGAQQNG